MAAQHCQLAWSALPVTPLNGELLAGLRFSIKLDRTSVDTLPHSQASFLTLHAAFCLFEVIDAQGLKAKACARQVRRTSASTIKRAMLYVALCVVGVCTMGSWGPVCVLLKEWRDTGTFKGPQTMLALMLA